MKRLMSLALMCAIMVSVVPVKAEAEASALARVKKVKAKEVTQSYKGWLGEGKKKTKVKYKAMQLSWKKVKGASGYVIYRYGNASGIWHNIKTIKKASTTTYILPEMYKKRTVKVKVVAYKKTAKGTVYGKESAVLSFKPKKQYYATLAGKVKTKNYTPYTPKGWYRFASEEAFMIQNEYRTQEGLSPIEWDEDIYNMAKIRSQECSVKYSHTRPNGETCSSVMDDYFAENECPELENFYNTRSCAENIAAGAVTPQEVMKAWKSSEGHWGNIIKKAERKGAISMYQKGDDEFFWSALFISKKRDEDADVTDDEIIVAVN